MFVENRVVRFVILLAIFGFTTNIIAEIPATAQSVRLQRGSLGGDNIFSMAVVGDIHKIIWVDGTILTEGISAASKKLYGEKIDGVTGVYFERELVAMSPNQLYWNDGIYYRTMDDKFEYIQIPVKLNLKIDGKILSGVSCQWEVTFPSHDQWVKVPFVKSMRVSFCYHSNINFTSYVFINIHPGANMLKNVLVTPDIDMETEAEEDQFIL